MAQPSVTPLARLKPVLFRLLTIVWILVIFSFSLQAGDESTTQSGFIVQIVVSIFKLLSIPTEGYNLAFWVRKTAHFTEYFILGFWVYQSYKEKPHKVFLYGAYWVPILDEWIQAFVPGRVSSPIDMGIDALGLSVGLYLMFSLSRRFRF